MRISNYRIFTFSKIRKGGTKRKIFLAAILILAAPACTGHDNPFDPKNKLQGNPFRLTAETSYGEILLRWNWPTYPVEGGTPIPLDSFLVHRKGPLGERRILRPHLQTTWVDTAGIIGDSTYQYQVAAFRGGIQSDLSSPASAFAYPLPLECSYIAETTQNEKWAIRFLENIKFISEGKFLRVLDANDIDIGGDCVDSVCVTNRISDMVVISSTRDDWTYLYLCSELFRKLTVFSWTHNSLVRICETDAIADFRIMAVDTTRDSVYIADSFTYNIYKFKVRDCKPTLTKMRTGIDPRRLAILSDPPRLFCANKGSNSVSVFDINSELLLEEIQVSAEPIDLWIGHDLKLYVACANGGTVVIIDPFKCEIIGEIRVNNPETGQQLFPRSVIGFADPQNRHPGVLAVATACTVGDECDSPGFLLYYSLADYQLQRYLKLPRGADPQRMSFLTRINTHDRRIYTVLPDRIWVCKIKTK